MTETEIWTKWESQIVNGVFPLRRFLGRSNHSVVFLTECRAQNLPNAAIKIIPADPALAEAQLSRWRSAAALSHPHLIRLLDSGRCKLGGHPFLFVVTEYAEQNLAQILPHRALTADEVRELLGPDPRCLGVPARQEFGAWAAETSQLPGRQRSAQVVERWRQGVSRACGSPRQAIAVRCAGSQERRHHCHRRRLESRRDPDRGHDPASAFDRQAVGHCTLAGELSGGPGGQGMAMHEPRPGRPPHPGRLAQSNQPDARCALGPGSAPDSVGAGGARGSYGDGTRGNDGTGGRSNTGAGSKTTGSRTCAGASP